VGTESPQNSEIGHIYVVMYGRNILVACIEQHKRTCDISTNHIRACNQQTLSGIDSVTKISELISTLSFSIAAEQYRTTSL